MRPWISSSWVRPISWISSGDLRVVVLARSAQAYHSSPLGWAHIPASSVASAAWRLSSASWRSSAAATGPVAMACARGRPSRRRCWPRRCDGVSESTSDAAGLGRRRARLPSAGWPWRAGTPAGSPPCRRPQRIALELAVERGGTWRRAARDRPRRRRCRAPGGRNRGTAGSRCSRRRSGSPRRARCATSRPRRRRRGWAKPSSAMA